MARRNIRSAAALSRILEKKVGYKINSSHLTRYMKDIPPLLNIEFINALLAALDARITDLLLEEETTQFESSATAPPVPEQNQPPAKPKRRGKELPARALPAQVGQVKEKVRSKQAIANIIPNSTASLQRVSGPNIELFPDIYHEDEDP